MNFNLKKLALNASGFGLLVVTLTVGITQKAYAADYKNTRSYKNAYSCGIDALKDGSAAPDPNSLVATCIGNSHDPDKAEMQGFKDAIAAVRGKNGAATKCTFAYGVYQANGSRADNFEEGPQKVTTMKAVASLWPSREFAIYDARGARIPDEILGQWFHVTKKSKYGIEEIGLTNQARKSCSKKQIG